MRKLRMKNELNVLPLASGKAGSQTHTWISEVMSLTFAEPLFKVLSGQGRRRGFDPWARKIS